MERGERELNKTRQETERDSCVWDMVTYIMETEETGEMTEGKNILEDSLLKVLTWFFHFDILKYFLYSTLYECLDSNECIIETFVVWNISGFIYSGKSLPI